MEPWPKGNCTDVKQGHLGFLLNITKTCSWVWTSNCPNKRQNFYHKTTNSHRKHTGVRSTVYTVYNVCSVTQQFDWSKEKQIKHFLEILFILLSVMEQFLYNFQQNHGLSSLIKCYKSNIYDCTKLLNFYQNRNVATPCMTCNIPWPVIFSPSYCGNRCSGRLNCRISQVWV